MIKQSHTPYKSSPILLNNNESILSQLNNNINEFYKNNYYVNTILENNFTKEHWRIHYISRNPQNLSSNVNKELLFIALEKLSNNIPMYISLNELKTNFTRIHHATS